MFIKLNILIYLIFNSCKKWCVFQTANFDFLVMLYFTGHQIQDFFIETNISNDTRNMSDFFTSYVQRIWHPYSKAVIVIKLF